MNKHYDVAIIGGGASGLFCACIIKSKSPDLSVAIIEKQKSVGKKLLATGNGRCNLTNIYASADMYHGSFTQGVNHLLETCPPDMVINLFSEFGLFTTTDNEGRVYPLSRQSNSVLDVLTLCCKKYGVDIICEEKVSGITKSKDTFSIKTTTSTLIANKIVIATGSKATPETGADDSIFAVLEKLGHTTTPLYPALCPVKVKSKTLNLLKGVRAQGEVSISSNNETLKTERGEIQFTDKTLSGICVFNLSRIANTQDNCEITLSLLPDLNTYSVKELLKNKISTLSVTETADNLLIGIFNRKLSSALLKDACIDTTKCICDITDNELNNLTFLINNWKFEVIPCDDFTRAQVVAGGVYGSEIQENTMESKINKNLYIIGEAVDCDGDCGGLNLQFAFSSAYSAACDITK